ncbi:MAG TPA: ABC transporter ATP-binding protein [Stellaceae bacterium]|jgi:ATP-binding cassette subfamily B multidrug efflux pump|nr:ABC transporter ATP-binding protein [Stellaceae bacterium]
MFSFFERLIEPTEKPPEAPPPELGSPHALIRFYWHFVRQVPGLLALLFVAGFIVAMCDAAIPVFIGRIVTLVSAQQPETIWQVAGWQLLGMAVLLLVIRPAAYFSQALVTNQALIPGLTNLVRWQNHWHVVRQGWVFFQNDFAGRIANRVMQTGPALRESVTMSINAIWYILVYGTSAMLLLGRADWRLALPILLWFASYAVVLRTFLPHMRERSRRMSEMRSEVTGRVVDSYTNILTVKLFARARDEDAFVKEAVDEHTRAYRRQLRMTSGWGISLILMNAALLTGTGGLAIALWVNGRVPIGTVAMAIPMAWQIGNIAGWVAQQIANVFDSIGQVQDGMRSIAVTRQMPDEPGAVELPRAMGAVRFENVHFDYGRSKRLGGVLRGLDLDIAPGERVGLVGRSGAGKSTLVHLLLGFYRPEDGRILIDGKDVAGLTQESLRAQIGMVTQDTSLLHRSIRDNIRYGRPEASEADIQDAARRAHATEFIDTLEDWHGRTAFDAHVGERGVKLSGGQRQRIALARVILKDAPILVLDEATSALDSEVEAAIQEQLDALMEGRTVIAIAHRLSTICRMDRVVVLDRGRLVEEGSHEQLLARGGTYAALWRRQSGGFRVDIPPDVPGREREEIRV